MLAPLPKRNPRARVSTIENFPAPVGGWADDTASNSDGISTARILQNLIPRQNTAEVRAGSGTVANISSAVGSLMSYEAGSTKHLLGAAANKVYKINFDYDPGTGLVAPTELGTGFTSSRWQYVCMADASDATFLIAVNGSDGIWSYNGTAFTRVHPTTNDLLTYNNITSFKGRIWLTKLNSSVVYYADPLTPNPTTLTPFPMGPYLRKGGSIILIDSMSVDGGSGPDDYLVMISDRGEIIIYKGIDPGSDMYLVGVFAESKPLGPRCLRKMGRDLIYFSHRGPDYLTRLLPAEDGQEISLINPIKTEFEKAIALNPLAFGWDFVHYSRKGWVLFNIPIIPPTTMRQYVLNVESNSWFEITDWNALCWVQHDNYIFFGDGSGNIIVADFGSNDNGNAILVDYMQSWYEFKTSAKKKFNMAQATIKSNVQPNVTVDIMVDYEEILPESITEFALKAPVAPWDISPWDVTPWAGNDIFYVHQFGLNDIGYVGALRYRTRVLDSTHELRGFRIAFEEGEIL
jgi:hypothetical protein